MKAMRESFKVLKFEVYQAKKNNSKKEIIDYSYG